MRNLAFLFLLFAASCGNPKERAAIDLCKEYLSVVAKDPESLKFYEATARPLDDLDVGWEVTLDWGAKNGYGAMGRETTVFEVSKNLILKKDGQHMLFEKGTSRIDMERRLNERIRELENKKEVSNEDYNEIVDEVKKKVAEEKKNNEKKKWSFKDNPNGLRKE